MNRESTLSLPDIEGVILPELSDIKIRDKMIVDPSLTTTSEDMGDDELNACGAVMCLFGGGGNECKKYLSPFLAIEIFTATPPSFDPLATLDAREVFLSLCGAVSEDTIREVNTSARGSLVKSGVFTLDGIELTYWQVWLLEHEYDIDLDLP